MPLPVFHSVASYSVYRMMGKAGKVQKSRMLLALGLFLGILPDFDFLPGVLLGDPTLFHRDFSHSPLMAVWVSLLVGLMYAIFQGIFAGSSRRSQHELRVNVSRVTVFSFLSYSTHLVLDYFSAGIPLFWPLTGHRFSCPMEFFQVARGQAAMTHVGGMHEFVGRLFSSAYAVPILFEVLMVLYVSAFVTAMRDMSGSSTHGRSLALIRVIQVLILTTLGLFVL